MKFGYACDKLYQRMRFSRLPIWVRMLVVALVLLFVWWLAHPRIAGIPAWLEWLGLLAWLDKMEPLNKWAATLVTLVAVLVALFQERIKAVFLQAKLTLRAENGISIPLGGNTPAHHYRLGVTSETGATAEYVEIFVTEVWANGQRLPWWSPSALGWTDGNKPYRDTLSGHTTRLCDFLMMVEPGISATSALALGGFMRPFPPQFDFQNNACLRVITAITPFGGLTLLFPGRYVIALDVSAKNARTSRHLVEVEFDGTWNSDPNAGLLSIKFLDSLL